MSFLFSFMKWQWCATWDDVLWGGFFVDVVDDNFDDADEMNNDTPSWILSRIPLFSMGFLSRLLPCQSFPVPPRLWSYVFSQGMGSVTTFHCSRAECWSWQPPPKHSMFPLWLIWQVYCVLASQGNKDASLSKDCRWCQGPCWWGDVDAWPKSWR